MAGLTIADIIPLLLTAVVWVTLLAVAIALGLRLADYWRSSPEDVLRRRFARGEITEAEYRHALATLRG